MPFNSVSMSHQDGTTVHQQQQDNKNALHLVYLGNALLDFSASCKSTVLEKYKLTPDDNCEYTKDQVGLFEELLKNSSVVMTPGGSAQNSARISRWLSRDLTSTVAFIGSLGHDSYGEILKNKVESAGVIACYTYHPTEPTGVSACLVTPGNMRTLCARLGAAMKFDRSFLKSARANVVLKNSRLLYVEGYFLSHSPECVFDIADFALKNERSFAFNVSAVYIAKNYSSQISELLPKIDVLFGNSKEIMALACCFDPNVCNTEMAVKILVDSAKDNREVKRIVVATDGPNPTLYCESGLNVKQCPVKPVEKIADTIGAGDAFVGAFLTVWFRKKCLTDAVCCGIETARLVVQSKGCVVPPNVPPAIQKFL